MTIKVLIRGGGDLASGVAARLHRAGMEILIAELPQPLVVRRKVAFAEAVYSGSSTVEEITAVRVESGEDIQPVFLRGEIVVMVDPGLDQLQTFYPDVLVDARMKKSPPGTRKDTASLVVGLGPGFNAGLNCHAVIETMRGHSLGRVIWQGPPLADTGIPEVVEDHQGERVLRAPRDGKVVAHAKICNRLAEGDLIAEVDGKKIRAPFKGILRGLVMEGLEVKAGMKVGDIDPRDEETYCVTISDKSLSVGGGVLEAILSKVELRQKLP